MTDEIVRQKIITKILNLSKEMYSIEKDLKYIKIDKQKVLVKLKSEINLA